MRSDTCGNGIRDSRWRSTSTCTRPTWSCTGWVDSAWTASCWRAAAVGQHDPRGHGTIPRLRPCARASGSPSRALYDREAVHAIAWAVEHARECPSVSRFAAALGHTTRSLAQLLREDGLPPPNRLLLWGRLLLAGAYLGRDGRTVEETAFLLGYSTATALSRAMKREIGKPPTEVGREEDSPSCRHGSSPAAGRGGSREAP